MDDAALFTDSLQPDTNRTAVTYDEKSVITAAKTADQESGTRLYIKEPSCRELCPQTRLRKSQAAGK